MSVLLFSCTATPILVHLIAPCEPFLMCALVGVDTDKWCGQKVAEIDDKTGKIMPIGCWPIASDNCFFPCIDALIHRIEWVNSKLWWWAHQGMIEFPNNAHATSPHPFVLGCTRSVCMVGGGNVAAMHFALRIATEHTANVTPDLYERFCRFFCFASVAFLRLFRILRSCLGEQMLVLRLISRNTFSFTRNCDGV